MMRKTLILESLILITFLLLNAYPASSIEQPIFYSWVTPGYDFMIMDDLFEVEGFPDDDERVMLFEGNESFLLRMGDTYETDYYRFSLSDSRLDQDNLDETGPDDMPWYGTIRNGSNEWYYSFLIEVELLRPILEFKREVNGVPNYGSEVEIDAPFNEPINVSLEILNHGLEDSEFIHEETIPSGASIEIINQSGVEISVDDNVMTLIGDTEDSPKVEYQIIHEGDLDFTFESESRLQYADEEYNFEERNKTHIRKSSGISIESGYYNGRIFTPRNLTREIGTSQMFGTRIENDRNEEVDVSVRIDFPGSERKVVDSFTGRRYLDDHFEEDFTLENNTVEEIAFNVTLLETGKEELSIDVNVDIPGAEISENHSMFPEAEYLPPGFNVLMSDVEENMTTDMTMFLAPMNDNNRVEELFLDISLHSPEDKHSSSYRFSDIEIKDDMLINSFTRYLRDPNASYVSAEGFLVTEYGEKIDFSERVEAVDAIDYDYWGKRTSIMIANNLDERYESTDPGFNRGVLDSAISSLTGMVAHGDDGESRIPSMIAGILFVTIVTIEFIIIKRKKRNASNG